MSSIESKASPLSVMSSNSAWEYLVDATQRSVLFWDVMRQRGEQYREHMAQTVPHVLHYEVELVLDGRTLPRPVNYGLTRVVPPKGVKVDPTRRPFVIIDPRAGHGPGIGGFKADSEIGVALKAGHPCYFVGFRARSHAGPDHRGYRARRGDFYRKGPRARTRTPTPSRASSATARPGGR